VLEPRRRADFVEDRPRAAAIAGYELDEIARTGHPLDHPVHPDTFPEGRYLKAIVARPTRAR
jgi:23S rRNA G2069 N7-methylase RlmK/C1962 C5-methylase RlmI